MAKSKTRTYKGGIKVKSNAEAVMKPASKVDKAAAKKATEDINWEVKARNPKGRK